MSAPYRTKARAVVHPINGAPFKPFADLNYRDNKELTDQLATYAKTKYPRAKIQVDVSAKQIIVNGRLAAGYSLVDPAPAQHVKPRGQW